MASSQIAVITDIRMLEPTLTAMMSAMEHSSWAITVHFLGHGISDKTRHLQFRHDMGADAGDTACKNDLHLQPSFLCNPQPGLRRRAGMPISYRIRRRKGRS